MWKFCLHGIEAVFLSDIRMHCNELIHVDNELHIESLRLPGRKLLVVLSLDTPPKAHDWKASKVLYKIITCTKIIQNHP